MGGDFKQKNAVSASVEDLVGGRLAQREPTKYEGAGVVSDNLLSVFPLLADHLDGLKLLNGLLGDANPWED